MLTIGDGRLQAAFKRRMHDAQDSVVRLKRSVVRHLRGGKPPPPARPATPTPERQLSTRDARDVRSPLNAPAPGDAYVPPGSAEGFRYRGDGHWQILPVAGSDAAPSTPVVYRKAFSAIHEG